MKVLSICSAFALFCTLSQAQNAGISITAPALGAVWTAGKTEIVSWSILDPSVSTISSVELRNGGSANLQLVSQVGSGLLVSTQQWSWEIPSWIKTDSSYVLVFTSNKGATYSPYFTIMASNPNAAGNSTTSSSKATSVGSNSSGSSGSNSNISDNNAKPSSTASLSSTAANASTSHSSNAAAVATRTAAASKGIIFLAASGMLVTTMTLLL
ncbi:hypothetical protein BX666DRAFT_1885369 [Dichotomocladium elegans]|nr:hypothetical protein BX666DRAFT_1885369 [Dichotomocladium elegans]